MRFSIPGRKRGLAHFHLQQSLAVFGVTLLLLFLLPGHSWGQSTFGSFTGVVKDPSGKVIRGAQVKLTNTDNEVVRPTMTNSEGEYIFPNVDAGTYSIEVSASGFANGNFTGLTLQARDAQRVDAILRVGAAAQTVTVQAGAAVVNTETSNLGETRTGIELEQLPLAISSRASGSTSPYQTLTSQAGVQSDSQGTLSVSGAKPASLSVTVDGISTMNVESSAPAQELFPSFASIEEIQVNENNNAAEYGGVADITTVSKGGTNNAHGGAYENYETAGFNAKNPFSNTKPKIVMNDFGVFYGAPISIPKLYNGKDNTFFFLDYEGLRLPQQTPVVQSVPSVALRSGDLSVYSNQIYNVDGTPFVSNQVPVSSYAANTLKLLFPLPNFGASGAIANNYVQNFPTPISSNQGDARFDQNFTAKQSAFVRFSYKKRSVEVAPSGSALIGSFNEPEIDMSLTAAHSYAISSTMFNELRVGFSRFQNSTSFAASSNLVSEIGITGIPDLLPASVPAVPNFSITGFNATGAGSVTNGSRIIQMLDNFTWNKGSHLVKTGVDYRYMNAFSSNVFGSSRLGKYTFNGSSAPGQVIGNPYAQFLLGIPDQTQVADVLLPDMNGYGDAYAFYVQDSWKVNPYFTINYGLRYEFHPTMRDHHLNNANFDPDYQSVQNGQVIQGAVVVPTKAAISTVVIPSFAAGISPMPIISAQQAGLPTSLVAVAHDDFAPRIGFAWQAFHNNKTVVRGGWGRFIEASLGATVLSGWGVSSSAVYVSQNSYVGNTKTPLLSFPSPFQFVNAGSGTLEFSAGAESPYHDPAVQQWNLTVEQDLGFSTSLRLSYIGSHASNLTERVDLNQLPYNTVGFNTLYASRPFPELSQIEMNYNLGIDNYNSFTVEVNRRMARGLQFSASYTLARDLSDEGGAVPPAWFAREAGSFVSDRFHPALDYGNVEFNSRNRFLGSFLYQLPFGDGQMLASPSNRLVNDLIGGWQVAGFLLLQSGPFMTPLANSAYDPTGTGIANTAGYARPDRVPGVSPYTHGLGARNYLNPAAFAEPPNNVARQGTAAVGSVVGPGMETFSASLFKNMKFTERFVFQAGVQGQNLFNHQNLSIPSSLVLGTANYGQISSVQTLGNAGPRSLMLTGRLTF
ncbi:carboxypeptidase-like regulatory domain-containing protein [Granulicella sp. L60]|uniref:carboxypeptidase-like regulatory domain-containing protein n=1 Tax=Granulicella sp. L60 TaxID=1641866 RepID=UPI00131C143C|nr:carboxypeptidase-like regulatory domain-containing protein [Granulicella sp. L60]